MLFGDLMHFIEKENGISVSLEACHPFFLQCPELILAPDQYQHHIPFCRAVKHRDGNRTCSANKKRSLRIARYGRCFAGKCPFGIIEYAVPVRFENRTAAVIYLGGAVRRRLAPAGFLSGRTAPCGR